MSEDRSAELTAEASKTMPPNAVHAAGEFFC
jgi:hypothetical protein